jgi:hypothetical protein
MAIALIIPVIAMAGELNMTATNNFTNAVKDVEATVDEAGALLDTAEVTFFSMLDSIVELPEFSVAKEEVMATLESATKKKDVEAAQELYETYLAEAAAREDALTALWENSDTKAEITTYFSNRKEMTLSIKDNAQKAVELDIEAIKALTDLPEKFKAAGEDIANQTTADPTLILSAKKVIKAIKEANESIKTTKEKATKQKETAEKLLNWLKDLV